MKRYIIAFVSALAVSVVAEAQNVEVTPLNFFSHGSQVCPFVVDSTLYFSSNVKTNITVNYYDESDNRLFQLFKVPLKNSFPAGSPKPAMKRHNRPYNQSAITFDAEGKIHITQNTKEQSTIQGAPLAIFDYRSLNDRTDGIESETRVRFANAGYPAYSPDGNLMVFVSDAPGGRGQTDLYYCEKRNGRWTMPRSMGDAINTTGAETTPFIHPSGKIFFASNGRSDSKKLDIYYTFRNDDGKFAEPVRFDISINSIGDDFGFYYSDDEEWGFFTSNRHGRDKIYYFKQLFPHFDEENEMVEENYCYTFFEESAENYDPAEFGFKWVISDGHQYNGLEIDHCFAGPGDYNIALNVLDKTSGEELFTIADYDMELRKPEQVNIHVPENIQRGKDVVFTADDKNITAFTPTTYYWDFGNGVQMKGQTVKVKFKKSGTYRVRCGTIADEDWTVKLCTWVYVTVE